MSSISEIYRVRQRAVEYAIKHNNNLKAAVKYKTSCQQIKRWRDRYDGTVQSLMPRSRRPKSHPNQHTQEEINLVMKKYRKFGYEGLSEVCVKARKEGYSRTYDSMCKIIRKMKGDVKEKPKKLHKRKKKIEQVKYPGERVQIDIKHVPEECIQFGARDQKYYQITALDEYTRKRVLRIVDEKSTYQTSKFLEVLEKELEFVVKKVQTDNGKEFKNSESEKKTLFELKLEEKGIEYGRTRPYSPWKNGKVERSHRLDIKYHAGKKFKRKEELLRAVRKYNTRYNNISRKVLGFKSSNEVLKRVQ